MQIQDSWSDTVGRAWWVEIFTAIPHCTYYFGPFATEIEAESHKFGYIEDLEGELAEGIRVTILYCQPVQITIDRESEDLYRSSLESQFPDRVG